MTKSTKPDDGLIKKQAERLLTLPNNPGTATELAIALRRFSKSNYHAKAIVQYLLDNEQFFPTPSAVKYAAECVPSVEPPKYRSPNPKCSKCSGSGNYVIEQTNQAAVCPCRIIGAPMPPDYQMPDRPANVDLEPLVEAKKL